MERLEDYTDNTDFADVFELVATIYETDPKTGLMSLTYSKVEEMIDEAMSDFTNNRNYSEEDFRVIYEHAVREYVMFLTELEDITPEAIINQV